MVCLCRGKMHRVDCCYPQDMFAAPETSSSVKGRALAMLSNRLGLLSSEKREAGRLRLAGDVYPENFVRGKSYQDQAVAPVATDL
jgi:hypothetical protein